jgi:hypothetical protein
MGISYGWMGYKSDWDGRDISQTRIHGGSMERREISQTRMDGGSMERRALIIMGIQTALSDSWEQRLSRVIRAIMVIRAI